MEWYLRVPSGGEGLNYMCKLSNTAVPKSIWLMGLSPMYLNALNADYVFVLLNL